MKKYISILSLIILPLLVGTSCQTAPGGPGVNNALAGGGLGALAGAATGAIAGNNIKGISKTEGAVAGAIVGGLLGTAIGNNRDTANRQNADLSARIDATNQQANSTVINVTNSNGSYTPVVLHRNGNGWVGPRGEMYNTLPTESQLKGIYGI
ncbi:MAG: hypothetical protein ACI9TH_003975 [Kiritimatiellia bacterium]|jgi:hypothetical protein